MSNSQPATQKTFHHPLGLPGKDIKLREQQGRERRARTTREVDSSSSRDRSPLGISLNTNVAQERSEKPHQIFPIVDQDSSSRATSRGLQPDEADFATPHLQSNGGMSKRDPLNQEAAQSVASRAQDNAAATDGFGQTRTENVNSSKTPIIVLESPKSQHAKMSDSPREARVPRPPSSVYTAAPSTRSTPARKGKKFPQLKLTSIPPIPRLGMPFASIKTPVSARTPPSSAGTDFGESEKGSATSSKRPSPTSAGLGARRLSLDMVPPTPRRSRGWWNVILSPFEAKRMTLTSSPKDRAYTTDPDAPEIPIVNHAAPMGDAPTRDLNDSRHDAASRASVATTTSMCSRVHGGEADKYYDPNQHFGDDKAPSDDDDDDEEHYEGAHGPVNQHAEEVSGDAKQRGSDEYRQPAHPIVPETSPTPTKPNATQDKDYFSGFSSATPIQAHHHAHHQTTTSPKSPFATMSPGVVEVADARPIQTARSVQTKSYQGTLDSTRQPDRPNTEAFFAPRNEHHMYHHFDEQPPQKPALPKPAYLEYPVVRPAETLEHEENSPRWYYDTKRPKNEFVGCTWHKSKPSSESQHVEKRFQFNKPKKQRWVWTKERKILAVVAAVIFFILLLTVILAMTLTRHHHDMPVAASWLNLTGMPAIPTGIATIAGPTVKTQSSCVTNADLWSCALPKEQQASVFPSKPDQPNFRVEIRFTGDDKLRINSSSSSLFRRSLHARSLSSTRASHAKRDAFSDLVTWASPPPPSDDEQAFLGNTTDDIAEPFAGEKAPFTISLLPTVNLNTTNSSGTAHSKRDGNSTAFDAFPRPAVAPNNTIADALLLPYPVNQPLKLYNHGMNSEHYGFYTYFDRSLFLRLASDSSNATDPANANGGSTRQNANAKCTWSQTRLLVQIWTKPSGDHSVTPASSDGSNSSIASATTFNAPGTFPLPVTVTMDRHGGDAKKKAIYCYGLDQGQHPLTDQKGLVGEARDFGGTAVNPAPGPFEDVETKGFGGSDGGSGGCNCQWTNF